MNQVTEKVVQEIAKEREWRIDRDMPDGLSHHPLTYACTHMAKGIYDKAAMQGDLRWFDLLYKVVTEAEVSENETELRGHLVQLAALTVEWIEAIDRRETKDGGQ